MTAQEEKAGLLAGTSGIGTRDGWERRLAEKDHTLKRHRLVIRKTASDQDGRAANS